MRTHQTPPADGAGVSLLSLASVLLRRKLLIATTVVLMTGACLGLALLQSRLYRAEVLLQVEQRTNRIADGNVPAVAADLEGGGLASQTAILRSHDLILQVIRSQGLAETPEFRRRLILGDLRDGSLDPADRYSIDALVSGAVRGARELFGLGRQRPDDLAILREWQDDTMIRFFLQRLDVDYDLRGTNIWVRYTSDDPALAARVANALAGAYVERQVGTKRDLLRSAGLWLNDRLSGLATRAVEMEERLASFREAHDLSTVHSAAFTQQQFNELNTQLMEIIGQQAAVEARARGAEAAAASRRLQDLPDALASSTIRALREQEVMVSRRLVELAGQGDLRTAGFMRAEAAEVTRRINEELERIYSAVRAEASIVRNRRAALEASINSLADGARERERLYVRAATLQREAAEARQIHDAAVRQTEEMRTLAGLQRPDIMMVSEARMPLRPYKPQFLAIGALGVLMSLIFGSALALFLEFRRLPLRSLRAGEAALGVPALGWLPQTRGLSSISDLVVKAPTSLTAQAMRSVAVSLKALFRRDHHVVLVTSAVRGEGKSRFAIGYARAMAMAGRSCLLIDADLHRPSVADTLRLPAGPGLVELTSGKAGLADAIRIDEASGLSVIGANGPAPDALRVLDSPAMAELIRTARERFDMVVLDAPPVLARADALMLSQHADVVVNIVGWSRTPLRLAQEAISRLRAGGASAICFVMVRVDITRIDPADSEGSVLDYHRGDEERLRAARLRVVGGSARA